MLRLVIALPSPVCEVVVVAAPEAASLSASRMMLLTAMVLWELLWCAAKDQVLNLSLGVEAILRRLCTVAPAQVQRFGE
jgi:hypothetical protein